MAAEIDPCLDWKLRNSDLAVAQRSRSLLEKIWAKWMEKLLWNLHDIQKSLGKLHRMRALKSVPSVIFTSSGSDGLFVLSTTHTTSTTKPKPLWCEGELTEVERAKLKTKHCLKLQPKRGINSVFSFASKAIWYLIASKLLNTERDHGSSTVWHLALFTGMFPLTPKHDYKRKRKSLMVWTQPCWKGLLRPDAITEGITCLTSFVPSLRHL